MGRKSSFKLRMKTSSDVESTPLRTVQVPPLLCYKIVATYEGRLCEVERETCINFLTSSSVR